MYKVISCVLLVLASSSANAEWVKINTNENLTTYIDPTTITKVDNMVKMWGIVDLKESKKEQEGKSFLSAKGLQLAEDRIDAALVGEQRVGWDIVPDQRLRGGGALRHEEIPLERARPLGRHRHRKHAQGLRHLRAHGRRRRHLRLHRCRRRRRCLPHALPPEVLYHRRAQLLEHAVHEHLRHLSARLLHRERREVALAHQAQDLVALKLLLARVAGGGWWRGGGVANIQCSATTRAIGVGSALPPLLRGGGRGTDGGLLPWHVVDFWSPGNRSHFI